jgi:aryl-alcohol dehydrogenase-like predicted oxidoreductase
MLKAREVGINFLDDARYNDETGTAPLKTGYSEVVFGELFRAAGWRRDEVILANKLWWEFWPQQSAAQELDESLQRMGMDYIDLVYAERPPPDLAIERIVHDVNQLIEAGKIRAWGVLNWRASHISEASQLARRDRKIGPCAAQLPYSLAMKSPVEDSATIAALDEAQASVVASFTLVGGALTGKYSRPESRGRLSNQSDKSDYAKALAVGEKLERYAEREGFKPAPLAIAFALANPRVATVLFGATKPEQIEENLSAVELARTMDADTLNALRLMGV